MFGKSKKGTVSFEIRDERGERSTHDILQTPRRSVTDLTCPFLYKGHGDSSVIRFTAIVAAVAAFREATDEETRAAERKGSCADRFGGENEKVERSMLGTVAFREELCTSSRESLYAIRRVNGKNGKTEVERSTGRTRIFCARCAERSNDLAFQRNAKGIGCSGTIEFDFRAERVVIRLSVTCKRKPGNNQREEIVERR